MTTTGRAVVAALAIATGLVVSAFAGARVWPGVAAAINVALLMPGLLLTARLSRHWAAERAPLPTLAPLLMVLAILAHSWSLQAPAMIEADWSWGRPTTYEPRPGNWVFVNALVFFGNASSAHIPWWAANLVIALIPFAGGAHSPALRAGVAVLGGLLGVLAWMPVLDPSAEAWVNGPLHGLLSGYFVWASLCAGLGAALLVSWPLGGLRRP